MTKCFLPLLFLTALCYADVAVPSIIPQPAKMKLGSKSLTLPKNLVIYYGDASLKDAADALAEGLLSTHTIEATVKPLKKGMKPQMGSVVFQTVKLEDGGDYRLSVSKLIHIEARSAMDAHAAAASLLQSIDSSNVEKITIPKMVVDDAADKSFRALMVDVKNQWHSLDDLKQFVRLCYFYKVNFFSLHTGEEQWIAALCEQTQKIPAEKRSQIRLYTKAEMDELIAYAKRHGVYMFPHNESSPHFAGMKKALTEDFVAADKFAGFMDEFDGKGKYEGDFNDERFWSFMKVMTEKGIEQFEKPFKKTYGYLPYYHVGPIQGEGGMSSALGAKFAKFILDKSSKTSMMSWNGIAADDPNLTPFKKNIAIAYYQQWGGGTVNDYMKAGWNVVNSAYSPLYIVGTRSRTQEQVYNDWNLFRQGHDGFLNGAFPYDNIKWFNFADDGEQFQLKGGMLTTWEVRNEDHMPQLLLRLPAFAENAWQYKPWPYDEGRYVNFKARFDVQDKNVKRFLSPPVEPDAVVNASATDKVFADKISLIWAMNSGNALAYKIYRAPTDEVSSATAIATVEQTQYEDKDVEAGKNYYYWIESHNNFGKSKKVGPLKACRGEENKPALAYEGFDYADAKTMLNGKATDGWSGPWVMKQKKDDTVVEIVDGLSYEALPVSGQALLVEHHGGESDVSTLIERKLADKVGISGTSTWLSFLIHPKVIGGGHFMLGVGSSGTLFGKPWGGSLAATALANEQTSFVVYQVINADGKDVVYGWVNPSLASQPKPEDATMTVRSEDLAADKNNLSSVLINSQVYGNGQYILDELRLAYSWKDVMGGEDVSAPTPKHMTWELPPIVSKDAPTTVVMTSVIADDESGVEYYFKECSGNPGGADSGWIDKNFYENKGLQAGKTYQYKVKARDKSDRKNETEYSDTRDVEVK